MSQIYISHYTGARVPEKFLLHTDGTLQFGGYSGGPAFQWDPTIIYKFRLRTNIFEHHRNSALGPILLESALPYI